MAMPERDLQHRQIRSFVLREGRLTTGQQRAFETLWPKYGVVLDPDKKIVPAELFGNDRPVMMEIGFGNGESLAQYAKANPQINYIGIEVHGPGIGHLLLQLEELGLENVRIFKHDAVEIMQAMENTSLAGIMLFFPDPWHKKRHHKRRILKPEFVEELARLIIPEGYFHAATDWRDYAEQMMKVLMTSTHFINSSGTGNYTPRPADRPLTKFERRGQRLGHGVWDLVFKRTDG